MKKKIFNLLKLFVLVLALFISFTGMKLNVFAAQSEFVGEPSLDAPDDIPIDDEDTSLNHEPVLVSLKGATVTVPSGWSSSVNDQQTYFISYLFNDDVNCGSFAVSYGWNDKLASPMPSIDNCYCLAVDNTFAFNLFSNQSITLTNITGNDTTNQKLIQWFIDNNATIIGGIYSDDVVSVTNDIGDTKLVWELNWLETTEETVSDYVEIYPSSDTKQCYIVFKKSFSIPMQLIVKSEDDESVYASCDVDCYERTETVGCASLSVSLDGSTNSDLLLGQDVEENEITFNGNTSYESIFTDQKIEINSMTATTSKVGTLATIQEVSYNIGLSEELQTLLEDREIKFVSTTSILITSPVKGLLESLITFTDDNKQIIYEALNTCDNWFRVDVEVVDKYHDEIINEYLYTINIIGFVINDYYVTTTVPTDLTGYTVSVPAGWTASTFGVYSLNYNGNARGLEVTSSSPSYTVFGVGTNKGFEDFSENNCCMGISLTAGSMNYNIDNENSFALLVNGGNDVSNPNLIQWFVSVGATFTKTDSVSLISFSLAYNSNVIGTYQAEEGMTWAEWEASEYNTDGYSNGTNGEYYITNRSDVIEDGATYTVLLQ